MIPTGSFQGNDVMTRNDDKKPNARFIVTKLQCPPPPKVRASLDRVLTYLWKSEREDFVASTRQQRRSHIFSDLFRLREWASRMDDIQEQSRREKG
jgi:hypothetical protein